MMPLVSGEDQFIDECIIQVTTNSDLNNWYDPISVFTTIEPKKICESQLDSFRSVDDLQDVSEFLSASYLSSLSVNMDAQIKSDYDKCINQDVTDDPNTWATNYVSTHPMF